MINFVVQTTELKLANYRKLPDENKNFRHLNEYSPINYRQNNTLTLLVPEEANAKLCPTKQLRKPTKFS